MLNYQRVASQIVFGSIGVKFVILIDNLLYIYNIWKQTNDVVIVALYTAFVNLNCSKKIVQPT